MSESSDNASATCCPRARGLGLVGVSENIGCPFWASLYKDILFYLGINGAYNPILGSTRRTHIRVKAEELEAWRMQVL